MTDMEKTGNRLFSQTEVDEIVRKRLQRERAKVEARAVPSSGIKDWIQDFLTVPDKNCNLEKWLKGASEGLNATLERLDEIRSTAEQRALTETEQRALEDLSTTSDILQANIAEVVKRRNAALKPVEDRTFPEDQEEELLLDYAFKPEAEKESIKKKVLDKNTTDRDPAYKVLRKTFERLN